MNKNSKLYNEVDAGWRYFWKKRGYYRPFEVSRITIGAFDMPSNPKSWSQ